MLSKAVEQIVEGGEKNQSMPAVERRSGGKKTCIFLNDQQMAEHLWCLEERAGQRRGE